MWLLFMDLFAVLSLFSHTDLMKRPCLAVKACQQHEYLFVLYIEKLLKQQFLYFDVLNFPRDYFTPLNLRRKKMPLHTSAKYGLWLYC